MTFYRDAERLFIAAILHQALVDYNYKNSLGDSARRFIRTDNKLFCYYCHLLEMEPEYVARKMLEEIKRNKRCKRDLKAHYAMYEM